MPLGVFRCAEKTSYEELNTDLEQAAQILIQMNDILINDVAVIPQVGGRLHPLHAVWARMAAPALRSRLEAGERGVLAAASALGARVAGPDVWGVADPTGAFARNVNRPEDLTGA